MDHTQGMDDDEISKLHPVICIYIYI